MKKETTNMKTDASRSRHERICPIEIFLAEEDTVDFPPPRGDTEDEACASNCLEILRRCLGIVDC